ncbi:Histidinol dehydrogenase [uncultured archaeon]|nr:Histidinol dehydrogenase [uncultured archaeon]
MKLKTANYPDTSSAVKKMLTRKPPTSDDAVEVALKIIQDVVAKGDQALYQYTQKFDGFPLSGGNFRIIPRETQDAYAEVKPKFLKALKHARRNIAHFHEQQLKRASVNWKEETESSVIVGEKTTPIGSVGCYIPGGRAKYPSTVLMTALVAKIAGVPRVVVVSPPPISPEILVACDLAGVDEVYRIGGAQAIAALAYGTQNIPPVDKIVGPGNKYVTAAKKLVYGVVDVDMPAGPSEVLIIADHTADPRWVAWDLAAQAEHDPDARVVLATTEKKMAAAVSKHLTEIVKDSPRKAVMEKSLEEALVVNVKSIESAIEFANKYAPEHLEIHTEHPSEVAEKISFAGAIFVGENTPVAIGDYAAGSNHTLPTSGAAKFASPLSVRDFLKTTSTTHVERAGLKALSETVETLAEAEGLMAHKESIKARFK